MARDRKSLVRLETLALIALHAFPALYSTKNVHDARRPAAFIIEGARQELLGRLAAMPILFRALVVIAWPPTMILMACGLTIANGLRVRRRFHRSIMSQFTEQIRLAFGYGMPPMRFYFYELHEPKNRMQVQDYILRGHLKRGGDLYKQLYRACPQRGRRASILNDKIAFSQFCREHKLPAPRVFAYVENGIFRWADTETPALPQAHLFIKPAKENGGDGTERWIYSDGKYRGKNADALSRHRLMEDLAWRSLRAPLLVQECLVNHPALRDLTAGALSTLRMYTFLNEAQEVEHIFSMLRMSQDPRRIVDNVCRGGLAAKVDPETGTIGLATDGGILARTGWLDRHPLTGAKLLGHPIPFWPEALQLATSAHRKMAAPFMVGWDIAITDRGPVIVEGNKAPDIEIEQRLTGPWANQRFGELLAYHIKSAPRDVAVETPPPVLEGAARLAATMSSSPSRAAPATSPRH